MERFELIRIKDGSREKICEVEETSPDTSYPCASDRKWTFKAVKPEEWLAGHDAREHPQENLSDFSAAEAIGECLEEKLEQIRHDEWWEVA